MTAPSNLNPLPPRRFRLTLTDGGERLNPSTYYVYGCQWADQTIVVEWILPSPCFRSYKDVADMQASSDYGPVTAFAYLDDYGWGLGYDAYGAWFYGG